MRKKDAKTNDGAITSNCKSLTAKLPREHLLGTIQERGALKLAREFEILLRESHNQVETSDKTGEVSVATIRAEIIRKVFSLAFLFDRFETQQNKVKPSLSHSQKDVIATLRLTAELVVGILESCSKQNNPIAAGVLWDIALRVTEMVGFFADHQPSLLKETARHSLYMPSRRARAVKFTDNFGIRADSVELSKDLAIKTTGKALYDLESESTKFAISHLNRAQRTRELILSLVKLQQSSSEHTNQVKSYDIVKQILEQIGINSDQIEIYLKLPPYCKATAKQWWEKIIKPIIDDPATSEKLKAQANGFYNALATTAKLPVDYEIRQELKDACKRQVLNSLAPDLPQWNK